MTKSPRILKSLYYHSTSTSFYPGFMTKSPRILKSLYYHSTSTLSLLLPSLLLTYKLFLYVPNKRNWYKENKGRRSLTTPYYEIFFFHFLTHFTLFKKTKKKVNRSWLFLCQAWFTKNVPIMCTLIWAIPTIFAFFGTQQTAVATPTGTLR
jgi:hypothetical protein